MCDFSFCCCCSVCVCAFSFVPEGKVHVHHTSTTHCVHTRINFIHIINIWTYVFDSMWTIFDVTPSPIKHTFVVNTLLPYGCCRHNDITVTRVCMCQIDRKGEVFVVDFSMDSYICVHILPINKTNEWLIFNKVSNRRNQNPQKQFAVNKFRCDFYSSLLLQFECE